ncbi:hypothetical protein ES703_59920 [subsurface metagenome]
MIKMSFACLKRRRRTPPDRAGFSIPVRSSHLNLLYVGQVGGLNSESLRSSPLPGFLVGFEPPGLLVLGVWGSPPASLDYLIITTRDRLAKIWLISIFYLRSRGVRNV